MGPAGKGEESGSFQILKGPVRGVGHAFPAPLAAEELT